LFVAGAVFLYWVGTGIPIPGIDADAFALDFWRYASGYLHIINILLGDGVRRVAILSLGVLPYISALI
jgi:preprotein translocase subunit SecY